MITLGAFAIILDDKHRLCCVRMNYGHRGWTTPGGRIETGESPIAAVKREVWEETGYETEIGELIGVYFKAKNQDLVFNFEARVTGRVPWTPNDEIAEVRFFAQEELPENISEAVRIRIADGFSKKRGIYRELDS